MRPRLRPPAGKCCGKTKRDRGAPDVVLNAWHPGMIAEAVEYAARRRDYGRRLLCPPRHHGPGAAKMKELTARFVVAYDKADFDMMRGFPPWTNSMSRNVHGHRGAFDFFPGF
ncbi:MAG: hypothetical protein CM15mP103_12280 [Gammaproteobacteria bacterium]|nr:MAG: hypothetical protein CM15mP103_12280 [Gammaproteobacteria bacterium]